MASELPSFKKLSSEELEALRAFLDLKYPNLTYMDISQALAVYFAYFYRLVLVKEYGQTERIADEAVKEMLARVASRIADSYEATVMANLPDEDVN